MRVPFRRLAIGSAVSVIAVATPALAQTVTFNVPSQAVATAVQQVARQAKIQIVVSGRIAGDRRTRAVSGAMSVELALDRMLAGTGLTFRKEGGGTYVIVHGRSATSAAHYDGVDEADAGRPDSRSLGSEDIVVNGVTSPFRSKSNATTVVESVVYDPVEAPTRDGSIAGLLAQIPGINTIEDGDNPRYIAIRGITPEYNLTTVDGLRVATVGESGSGTRRTNLQLIPSDFSKRVDVYKTFTAEQEADQIGGAVNIVTLSAFDPRQKALFFDIYGRYNTRGGNDSNDIGKSMGHEGWGVSGRYIARFGPNDQFGLVASGRYLRTPRHLDTDLEGARNYYSTTGKKIASPDPSLGWDGKAMPYGNPCYCSYNDVLDQYGGSVKLEFRSGSHALQASVTGYDYVMVQDYNANINYIYLTTTNAPTPTNTGYSFPINYLLNQYWHNTWRRENRGVLGNVSYDFGGNSRLIWRAGLSQESYSNDQPTVNSQAIPKAKTFANFDIVGDEQRDYITSFSNPDIIFNTPYKISAQKDVMAHSRERVFDTRLDFLHNVDRESRGLGFVVGGEFSRLNIENDTTETDYTVSPTTYDTDLIYDPHYIPYASPYSFGRLDFTKYLQEYWNKFPINAASSMAKSLTSDYGYYEDLKTAYVSAHYNLPGTTIVAGVRYDNISFTTKSAVVTGTTPTGDFTSTPGGYGNWLPSVDVVQRLGRRGNTILRGSYSNTLARPFPANIAAALQTTCNTSADDTTTCTITRGNPDLKPRKSRNLDASIEHYYAGTKGMVELSYFNKKIKDDIYTLADVRVIDGETYTYKQPMNGKGSSMQGVEFAWVHRGLPVGLSNHQVDLSANVTYLWGRMNYTTNTSVVTINSLGYQPNWIANASATYRIPKIGGGIRANFNYRGANLTSYGATPYTFAYRNALTTVNFAAWHNVTKNLMFKYEWNNALNGQPGQHVGQGLDFWSRSEQYGTSLFFHAIAKF